MLGNLAVVMIALVLQLPSLSLLPPHLLFVLLVTLYKVASLVAVVVIVVILVELK